MGLLDNDEDAPEEEVLDAQISVPDAPNVQAVVPPKQVDFELTPRPSNTYVLKPGDHPSSVADDLYDNVGLARELVLKNMGSKWNPGDVIQLL